MACVRFLFYTPSIAHAYLSKTIQGAVTSSAVLALCAVSDYLYLVIWSKMGSIIYFADYVVLTWNLSSFNEIFS